MNPIAVTDEEGGDWISWSEWQSRRTPSHKGKIFHTVAFDTGALFDGHCGWRKLNHTQPCKCLVCRELADSDFWISG